MTLASLTMSGRELDRAEWMLRLRERRTTQSQVAVQLGLTLRQVERLYRAYKAGGAAALVSKKRGRPSPRRLPTSLREQVVRLVRERYSDFGPTLAQPLREFACCFGQRQVGVWGPLHGLLRAVTNKDEVHSVLRTT